MKREFEVIVKCTLDLASAFDVNDIEQSLAEKFSHDGYIRCTDFYCTPYAWDWKELTNPDDIVNEITMEITEYATELGASEHDVLFWQRHGDSNVVTNEDIDIGYEIRWLSNPQVLFDLYLKKDKGIWNVYLDRNSKGDIPIACLGDLIEYYKKEAANEYKAA